MRVIRSIRHRTTLLICGLVFGVIVAYATAAYGEMKDAAILAASERLNSVTADVASLLVASTGQVRERITEVARDPALGEHLRTPGGGTEAAAVAALRGDGSPPGLIGSELRDRTGRRLLATAEGLPGPDEGFDPDLAELVATPANGAVGHIRVRGDSLLYPAAAPVERDREVIGHVVRWRHLETPEANRQRIEDLIGSGARLRLANTRGDVWTDLSSPVDAPPVDLRRLEGVTQYRGEAGGQVLVAGAAVEGTPWTVLVGFPRDVVLSGARGALRWLILIGFLLLLAGGAVAWVMSGRLTGSIAELAGAATAISAGDYSRRTNARGPDEIGALGAAFNTMAENVAGAHAALEQKVEELAASEAHNRDIRKRLEHVTSSSRAILYTYRVADREVPLDWISGNVERLLGYEVKEALELGWWRRVLHPDDRPMSDSEQTRLRIGGNLTREYRLRHADGEYRWIRDEQRILGDGDRLEVVGVFTDVTEHRRLEVAKEAAEAASKAKNEFLSRMSHELRTPLNAVLGFGQLLKMEVEGEENQESAEQVVKAGKHLLALIDEVLDIARIEAGEMSISVEPVSVTAVLRESIDLVRLRASEHGITLEVDQALRCDQYVRADRQRLKQVLLNLLSNGIKYNRREGTVRVSCTPVEEERLRIAVRDTGFGIPAGKMQRLFTPFDRLGAEQTAVEGTGLGLALSAGLVDAMGGAMHAESVEEEGSSFGVELPLAPPPELPEDEGGGERTPHAEQAVAASHTVLLVEDNLANVRLVERLLQRRPGVRLLTAMQGSLGLELARENRPDLILLDLNLPDISGERVLLQLRQDPELREVPVVMISGDAIPSQVRRLLDRGARSYLTKPFDIQELLDVVDGIIREEEPAS